MASNSVLDQEKRKGTNIEEYQKVKSNMARSIASIKAIPGAAESLTMEFIQREWLPGHARDITAENLFTQALDRIKNDTAEHGVFLQMLGKIEGTDQIVTNFTVTQEESAPTQSSEVFVTGGPIPMPMPHHHNGSYKPKAAVRPKLKPKETVRPELDSGYSDISPDLLKSHTPHAIPHQLDNYLGDQQEDDGSDRNVPIPTTGDGSVTIAAQQSRLDTVDYAPQRPFFMISEHREADSETSLASSPLPENSQMIKEAAIYLSTSMIEKLRELEERKKEVEKLKKKLQEETDAKEALEQEKEELNDQLKKLQENVKEKEEAAEKIIKDKENELEKYREKINEVQREKKEMESEHNEKVRVLEDDIDCLKKKIANEKRDNEVETLRLEIKLCKAERDLAEKENIIMIQKCTISELEKKSIVAEKDAEIQKLKKERRELRRGQSLSRSLSSLTIESD